jgi:hypothetical protein
LSLEVNGVDQGVTLTVGPGTQPVQLRQAVNLVVPARQSIRWRVSYDGHEDTAASALSLVLYVSKAGTPAPASYGVTWLNGRERFDLFSYSAASKQFTCVHPELPGLRYAQVVQDGSRIQFLIQGQVCLDISNGVVHAPGFVVLGSVVPDLVGAPRLQFCINGAPCLCLTPAGVWMPDLMEEDGPSLDGLPGYEFLDTAVLSAQQFSAVSFQEV